METQEVLGWIFLLLSWFVSLVLFCKYRTNKQVDIGGWEKWLSDDPHCGYQTIFGDLAKTEKEYQQDWEKKLTEEQKTQIEFIGPKRFMSNMWAVRFWLREEDLKVFPDIDFEVGLYCSTEHLYQGMKFVAGGNTREEVFSSILRPMATKKVARKYEDQVREDWDEIKDRVMALALYLKFSQNLDLLKQLREIDGEIVERNYWGDTYWGTCNGVGQNKLGKMLMRVREDPKLILEI